jgi:hypothetical protein
MQTARNGRRCGARRYALIAAVALAAPLTALLGAASPAMASNPYEKYFSQCPATEPGVELCFQGEVTSGEFAIGSSKTPIEHPVIQQGGLVPIPEVSDDYYIVPAKNGETISKTEESVPGGLAGLIDCKEITGSGIFELIERAACEAAFENGVTGVTATMELVANEHQPATLDFTNLLGEKGTAIFLPVRVHLKNPLLGESCYIGSEANPIKLHLTTGTTSPPEPNKPISGRTGKFSEEEGEVSVLRENLLVDNSFSVPTAQGCGGFFSFLLDPIVDTKLGLESPSGHNTVKLEGIQRIALAEEVAAG